MDSSFRGNGRVAVIGGGLAGIAATLALSDAGIDVDLFEANQRLGGRVGSFDDPISGESIDYCQHVGMGCCTNFLYLIERLGIGHEFRRERTLHFFSQDGRHLPLRAWPLPAPLHMSGLLLKWPDLRFAERLSIARTILAMMRLRESDPALDGLAIDWLQTRQSARVLGTFWKTILVSALGERMERVALRPAVKVLLDGFANHRDAYHLIIPKKPLAVLFNHRCREFFKTTERVQLHLGSRVTRIEPLVTSDGCKVTVTDNRGVTNTYDQVIVCVPWYRINEVITEHPLAIDALKASPITGIHTWWSKPWLNCDHAILVNRTCQWIFCRESDDHHLNNSWYYQIVISAVHDVNWQRNADAQHGIKEDLKRIFPSITDTKLIRSKIVTDPRAVFSVTPQGESSRPACEKLAEQGIWLAGDWTNTGWPATMEGAVRSGFHAAQGLGKKLGKDIALPKPDLRSSTLVRMLS